MDHLGPYFWVAEHGAAVVGYAYGRVEVSEGLAVIPAGERYLDIEELYVLSEYRNQGLGSDLVRALLRVAAENQGYSWSRALGHEGLAAHRTLLRAVRLQDVVRADVPMMDGGR